MKEILMNCWTSQLDHAILPVNRTGTPARLEYRKTRTEWPITLEV